MTNSSIFKDIPNLPPDALFSLSAEFQLDKREQKIDLTLGVYRDSEQSVPIMKAVKEAERRIFEKEETKRYLPIEGGKKFLYLTSRLLFGDTDYGSKLFSAQSLGGTGALFLSGKLLFEAGCRLIYLPNPTWSNHRAIFPNCGLQIESYPYKEGMIESLGKMPSKSVVLLHACCHNPTGIDPTQEEWMEISAIMKKRGLIPLFDCAYQGFGEGVTEDAFAVRYFANEGHEMCVAHSYSKNFGLYGERAGTLFVLSDEKKTAGVIKNIIRTSYSNPPIHSSSIVQEVLKDDDLRLMWVDELDQMRQRIASLRTAFAKALDNEALLSERGLFSYLNLSAEQVAILKSEHAIFMAGGGRINVSGLCDENIPSIVKALREVV